MVAALWLKTDQKGYTGQTRKPIVWDDHGVRLTDVRDGAGRPVKDRIPSIGFDGSDIHNMRPIKGVKRFVDYLRHDGHLAHVPMTNAAAHVPNEDESYQRDRRLKARYYGWIEWPSTGTSKCPCLMAVAGEINVEQLMSPACRGPARTDDDRAAQKAAFDAWRGDVQADPQWWGKPCGLGQVGPGKMAPCIHAIAEKIARQAARTAETAARELKSADAQAREAQAKQTAVLQSMAERQTELMEHIATTTPAPTVKDKR